MHLSIGQTLRLVIQAGYFVLIARSLGPDSYGAFVAVVSLAAVFGPFCGLGMPNLFIRDVRSGKRKAAICWGNGLLLIGISGTLLTFVVLGLNSVFHLKGGLFAVIVICVSDLIFTKLTELASFGFAAVDRMAQTSIQSVVISLLRFAAIVLLMITVRHVGLQQWVWAYLIATMFATAYAIYKGTQFWGMPELDLGSLRGDVSEGIFFSISMSATSIYNDVDKIMLGRLSDFAATGIYSAAYRLIDVSLTPVRSLVSAAYPEFFKRGVGGLKETYPYAKKLIRKSSLYGLAIFAGLWVFAPVLPHLLGRQYVQAIPALRWLSLIPLLRCFHVFLADSLTGAGYQRIRTAIQVGVGILNVGLNFIILPRYSWRGAAWTSLGCDAALVLVFWVTSEYLFRHPGSRDNARVALAMPVERLDDEQSMASGA